jgi:2-polyprenyl-3-methyl-5-hydroxy-6-metoxy-1,4-benzoquinol methylase
METEYVNCNLCGKDNWRLLFKAEDKILLIGGKFNLVKCNNCGLVYVNPRPTIKEMRKFYPPEYYARPFGTIKMTDKYKKEMRLIFHNRYKPFSKYKRKGKVLEIGCGDGYFLKFLKEKGYEVMGVELSLYASRYAREVLGLDVFTGTFEEFPAQKKSFDIICLFEVLEHLHNPLSSLHKIKDLLKDDGILVITVPNFSSFQRIIFGKSWHIIDLPRHLYHFTKNTLREMLKRTGLSILMLITVSNINHTNITVGYSESIRFWLREHNLYPSREKVIDLRIRDNTNKSLSPIWKTFLHKAEYILFYPIAVLMNKIEMGDHLYVCAERTEL